MPRTFSHPHRTDPPMVLHKPLAQDEALRALTDIRAAIDRTTRYSTFSALSGFVAGAVALAGSGLCGMVSDWPGAQPQSGPVFLTVWGVVFTAAALALAVFTALKARKRHQPVWTPIARTAFLALLGPGVAGVLGTLALAKAGHFELLPGLWLMLYGCGMYVVSFFAPLFLRALGVAFAAIGLAAWLAPEAHAALWLGLGFGVLHFVFGAIVLRMNWLERQRLTHDARI